MDFIINKADVSEMSENSDCSDNESLLEDFIVWDNAAENDSATFHRNVDNKNFHNQIKTDDEEIRDENLYFGEDGQPEMFAPQNIDDVEFHDFSNYKKKAADFKKKLLCFSLEDEPNLFFSSVIYALSYLQKNEKPADFPSAIQIVGQDRFLKLNQIEKEIMLDYTQFGFFDRCMKLNELLAREFGCFLRFYERRNKFRYQLRQKLKTKNEVKAELSSCVLQKFNGYDLLRVELALDKRKNLLPVDIVYEPTQDKNKPIYCYYAPKIHLAFQSVYDSFQNGKKVSLNCSSAKQLSLLH